MVPVAALVVNPGSGIAVALPLCGVGASGALIVFGACPELCGEVFGEIMGQSLPDQADSKTVDHDQKPVMGNGFKMLPWFHRAAPLEL